MKLLRVIRFDHSDDHVFARAAAAEEWCIPGGFEFADLEQADLTGKTRQAFANGFLGLPSFGRSTFATVAEITDAESRALADMLARHLEEFYGAPDHEAALVAAEGELNFAADLCADKPINTVFIVRRTLDEGQIHEEFREIAPPGEPRHTRIWDVVEDDA
jgi:hypothetical protein